MASRTTRGRITVVADSEATRDAGPEAPGVRASARDIEWSILMARAQSGDATAYRRLLEDILPYLRPLAARWHRDPRDVEDTVQDILLTLHTIRHT
jgi:RNA polymerase sigma-70 factor (ECF subfamily)